MAKWFATIYFTVTHYSNSHSDWEYSALNLKGVIYVLFMCFVARTFVNGTPIQVWRTKTPPTRSFRNKMPTRFSVVHIG